jgi:enoyl-CoA hydratase/carnithine racemase
MADVTSYRYLHLSVSVQAGVATATIDNPPVNVLTRDLFRDLRELAKWVEKTDDIKVLVLKSADPDFFICHFDVNELLASAQSPSPPADKDNPFNTLCEAFRTMSKVSIAQIEGRVGGGGSELVQAFDMRFGAEGRAILNHMEIPFGIIPGGGGTQRLPRIVGRGRALEILLGAQDIDAVTAERWGFLNRIFPPGELEPFVQKLAARIATFPLNGIRAAKQAVALAERPLPEGLRAEAELFQQLLRAEGFSERLSRFMENGGQTREVELLIGDRRTVS